MGMSAWKRRIRRVEKMLPSRLAQQPAVKNSGDVVRCSLESKCRAPEVLPKDVTHLLSIYNHKVQKDEPDRSYGSDAQCRPSRLVAFARTNRSKSIRAYTSKGEIYIVRIYGNVTVNMSGCISLLRGGRK